MRSWICLREATGLSTPAACRRRPGPGTARRSSCASSMARRLSSFQSFVGEEAAAAHAGDGEPVAPDRAFSPAAGPSAAIWSRQGEMPSMPCRTQPSIICARFHCFLTVAVLSDSFTKAHFRNSGDTILGRNSDELRPDDHQHQHAEHRYQHDERVLQRVDHAYAGHRAGDHQAQAVGRRHQPEGERDDADHGELHRVDVRACGQRLQDGADDDDRGDRVEEAADHQEHEGDEEAGADRPELPGRDAGEDRLRDLVVGEQPAERRRGADAEQRDRGEPAGIRQRVVQPLEGQLAVEERATAAPRRAPRWRPTRWR